MFEGIKINNLVHNPKNIKRLLNKKNKLRCNSKQKFNFETYESENLE